MPSSRKMILNHVMSGLCTKMNRTKQLPADIMETPLNRCLNTIDITLLGNKFHSYKTDTQQYAIIFRCWPYGRCRNLRINWYCC